MNPRLNRAVFWILFSLCGCLFDSKLTAAEQSAPNASEPFWFFQPIKPSPLPTISAIETVHNWVDYFIQAKREAANLEPSPILGRRALLRRVTFDLTGLPPTRAEMDAFLEDPRSDAYERVVDRLLASSRYGERWGRHWLDVVRYADTDGFAIDGERHTMWRYRDYIIRSWNEGRPFDQAIREQLAGDELDLSPEGAVATGFYRLGPWEADNMIRENRRQDYLNEVTGTIGTAFLGLTVGCARCHDHKYDPIPTRDFYRMQAFVAPVKRSAAPATYSAAETVGGLLEQKARVDAERATLKAELDSYRRELRERLASHTEAALEDVTDKDVDAALNEKEPFEKKHKNRLAKLQKEFSDFKEHERYAPVAVTITNPGEKEALPVTRVLKGGDVASPGETVTPGVLSAVVPWSGECYEGLTNLPEQVGGRRARLADWISSDHNPLTARVLVNRLWHYHFGLGLVATPDDFGLNGDRPSHPALLDGLAAELIRQDWRLKPIHKLLVTSRTYRQSTQHPEHAVYADRDPDNRLLWRAHFRRIEAEVLRDTMLAVSGELNEVGGGPGFREALPEEMGTNFPFFNWQAAEPSDRARRSVYLFQRRNMVMPLMEAFDVADASASCGRRSVSVNAPQVFMLFNGDFAHQRAAAFARRIRRECGSDLEKQVSMLFACAFGRSPSETERSECEIFLEEASTEETESALGDLCLALFNANEFCYLE